MRGIGVIIDRATDLRLLVAQASTSRQASNETAALAAVENEVRQADARVQRYGSGSPEWLQRLDESSRVAVSAAAARLEVSARRLADATDLELSAYAAGGRSGR